MPLDLLAYVPLMFKFSLRSTKHGLALLWLIQTPPWGTIPRSAHLGAPALPGVVGREGSVMTLEKGSECRCSGRARERLKRGIARECAPRRCCCSSSRVAKAARQPAHSGSSHRKCSCLRRAGMGEGEDVGGSSPAGKYVQGETDRGASRWNQHAGM